jgi:glycosyltransferase involved in cell wall biosynthesis
MKLVIQNTSHVWGGNEKWLATLASGLGERGHEVIVSCAMGPVQRELAGRGIATSPFRPRGAIDFVSGLAFAAWLRGQRPDALLLTSWRPTSWSIAAAVMAGVRTIVMRLGIVRRYPAYGLRSVALRRIDAIIVNSAEIRDEWLGSGAPHRADQVHVILNGVRSRIHERVEARRSLRAELGVEPGTLVIGAAGHIAPRKGFDILIHAFANAAVKDACLALIGDGPSRPELEEMARRLAGEGRIFWLGHRADGAGAIAGLDLFVLSSMNEGMANVMLEAMAGGTPVIAFDISGVRTALGASDGASEAGWIVPAANLRALQETIVEVCDAIRKEPESVGRRAAEAHRRVERMFSPQRMVNECEAVLFPR